MAYFREVERVTGQTVFWHHIHGKGLHAIVTDMCEKQAGGESSIIIKRMSTDEQVLPITCSR